MYTKKRWGERFDSFWGCVELALKSLEVYVHGSEERPLQAARGDMVDGLEAASVF